MATTQLNPAGRHSTERSSNLSQMSHCSVLYCKQESTGAVARAYYSFEVDMKEWAAWFYKSDKWKKVRLAYLVSCNYMCERCGRPAEMVHHKQYLNEDNINDPEISMGFGNLEALCDRCHQHEHHRSQAVRDGLCFDANGQLIQVEK